MVPLFKNRGENVTRLEGFSDTAFGFAITLLVVSLAVPTQFHELLDQLRGLPVFAVTFAAIATIWYSQYVFFRRFGLSDDITIVLNLVLLFVVLFFVYPLKFLFGAVFNVNATISSQDVPLLFLIYGVGYAAVQLIMATLYLHAYRLGGELGLSSWERWVTRLSIVDHLSAVAIGMLSAGLAFVLPQQYLGAAGFAYFLIAVQKSVLGWIRGNRARSLARAAKAGT
jgi:uncharacterized membrane protein